MTTNSNDGDLATLLGALQKLAGVKAAAPNECGCNGNCKCKPVDEELANSPREKTMGDLRDMVPTEHTPSTGVRDPRPGDNPLADLDEAVTSPGFKVGDEIEWDEETGSPESGPSGDLAPMSGTVVKLDPKGYIVQRHDNDEEMLVNFDWARANGEGEEEECPNCGGTGHSAMGTRVEARCRACKGTGIKKYDDEDDYDPHQEWESDRFARDDLEETVKDGFDDRKEKEKEEEDEEEQDESAKKTLSEFDREMTTEELAQVDALAETLAHDLRRTKIEHSAEAFDSTVADRAIAEGKTEFVHKHNQYAVRVDETHVRVFPMLEGRAMTAVPLYVVEAEWWQKDHDKPAHERKAASKKTSALKGWEDPTGKNPKTAMQRRDAKELDLDGKKLPKLLRKQADEAAPTGVKKRSWGGSMGDDSKVPAPQPGDKPATAKKKAKNYWYPKRNDPRYDN